MKPAHDDARRRASQANAEDDDPRRLRDWITPGTGLMSSLIVALLGPQYRTWYGDAMPAFSRHFLALYPLWIVLCAAALAARAFAGALDAQADARVRWKLIDAALGIVSVLVIVAVIVALALPVFSRASAM